MLCLGFRKIALFLAVMPWASTIVSATGLASGETMRKRASSVESDTGSSVSGPPIRISHNKQFTNPIRVQPHFTFRGEPMHDLDPAFRAQMERYAANMQASLAAHGLSLRPTSIIRQINDRVSQNAQEFLTESNKPWLAHSVLGAPGVDEKQRGRILGGMRSGETRRWRAEQRYQELVREKLKRSRQLKEVHTKQAKPRVLFHPGWPAVMTVRRGNDLSEPSATRAPSTDLHLATSPTYHAPDTPSAKRLKASPQQSARNRYDNLGLSLAPPGQ